MHCYNKSKSIALGHSQLNQHAYFMYQLTFLLYLALSGLAYMNEFMDGLG